MAVNTNSRKPKITLQPADFCKIADPNRKRALLELGSNDSENVSTPTRLFGLVEFDTNSDSEKPHFSETLGKYVTYLKSIKRPKINNSELVDGVDRVSRSIEGCIKLAESALGQTKTDQNPENSNPQHDQMGDIFSGLDRIDSTIIDCINIEEDTL